MAGLFSRIFGINRKKPKPTEVVGTGGTAIFGGFVAEREKNVALVGRQKYTTYSDILSNVSIVAAGTRYFLNLVGKAAWKVEPADDSPAAKEIAEKVELIVKDMKTPMARIARRAAMYRFYGFSVQEWTAVRRADGMIGMLDVEPRPQASIELWDVDEKCEVLGVGQRSPVTSELLWIPRNKIVYIVDDTLNDSPEGLGLFRHVVKPSQELCRFEELEGIGYETDLRGIPIGYAPLTRLQQLVTSKQLTAAQVTTLTQSITDFVSKRNRTAATGVLLDSEPFRSKDEGQSPSSTRQWTVDLLRSSSSNQKEVGSAIMRKVHEIARVLNVEGLLLGSGDKGSFALSRDKSNNLFLVVDSTLGDVTDGFNNDFIPPLGALNGWPTELLPTFRHEAIQFRDIEQITGALLDMAKAGAPIAPDDEIINEVRDLLGLPHAPDQALDSALLTTESEELEEEELPEDDLEGEDLENE